MESRSGKLLLALLFAFMVACVIVNTHSIINIITPMRKMEIGKPITFNRGREITIQLNRVEKKRECIFTVTIMDTTNPDAVKTTMKEFRIPYGGDIYLEIPGFQNLLHIINASEGVYWGFTLPHPIPLENKL